MRQLVLERRLPLKQATEITDADDVAKVMHEFIAPFAEDREVFLMLCLDGQNRTRSIHALHIGTLDSALVSTALVFKTAFLNNARSIVVGHNHPSGHPEPSPEDVELTHRLCAAGREFGIPVVDHVIFGFFETLKWTSLRQRGICK